MSHNAHATQNSHAGKHAGKKEPGTPRQRATIPILAGANSVAAAPRMSRVSRRTLHRWLKDEEFRQKLSDQADKSGKFNEAHSSKKKSRPSKTPSPPGLPTSERQERNEPRSF